MATKVEVQLLGDFVVRVDGVRRQATEWNRRRPMELVQLLALAPNRTRVRDVVIDSLWPHLDLEAGAANLRKAAHHARRVLGDQDAIVLRSGNVHLFPDAEVVVDLHRFLDASARALDADDPDACRSAADLWTGDLLPESPYEDWCGDERRRARTVLLSVLRVAGSWERIVEFEPTDEHAHRELMREALASGSRAEVVRRFDALRRSLASELGVRPSEESRAIYDQALAGRETRRPALLGRDVELASGLQAVRGPAPRPLAAVSVRGPGGIGKSAFSRELADAMVGDGWVVRWCDGVGHQRSYGPLVAMVDELLVRPDDVAGQLPSHARSVLASLSAVASSAPPVDGPLTRHQVLGAVARVLRTGAAGRRSVVVLDDAHTADADTLDVLVHMASSVPDVLVVFVHRDERAGPELGDGLDRLRRSGRLHEVDLQPLDPTDAEQLVRREAPDGTDDAAIDRVVERAAGNPFALIELARASGPGRHELPASASEAITARLVDVEEQALDALRRLALGPEELDLASVTALTGQAEGESSSLLDRLLDHRTLVVVDGRYRFRHDLVREALADQLPPHRRAEVHREAAARLEAAHATPAAVADQLLRAGEPAAAVQWCVRAAEDAMGVGAFRDARRHLAPVLAHEPAHPDALRLDAECLDMLGDPSVLTAYDAAIAAVDRDTADDLSIARALAQIKQGDPAGGLAAVRGATPHSPMARLNEALTYAGAAALGVTDPSLGTEKAAEVRRLALEAGDRAGIVIAAWAHAAAAHARGDLHDSVLRDLRDTKDLPHLAVRVFDGHLCMTQRFLYGSRPYDEVISFADELTAEAERLDALRGRAFGVTLRAEALYLSGHFEDARRDFADGLELHRETGGTTGEAHALQRLAELHHAAGRHADAHATIDEALDLARISDIGFHLLDRIYGSRITVSTDPDDGLAALDEAEAAVRGPLETCPGCRIHLAVPAALAAARGGDVERARRYADACDYLADVVMRLPAWYAARDEVRATLALAEGELGRAGSLFAEAAAGYARAGHPHDEARCLTAM